MKYECADCKDKGFIILLTSQVECDCRKTVAHGHGHQPDSTGRPYWFAGYESYAAYVADHGRRAS
jgi:hypothetical protein